MISKTPTYNLMVVMKETGLKADVLRAWEKRYGLPSPQRTEGGHRLYSEFDIATLKWLQARITEGLSISRAVMLWNDIVSSGREPLDEMRAAVPAMGFARSLPLTESLEVLRHTWLEACLRFDSTQAEETLNQAFASYPIEKVGGELLGEGLRWIGDQWYLGQVTIYQEHFASAIAVRRIQSLITSAPPPMRNQTVVIGCPPGELHTFPALYLNLLLLQRGLHVVFLGADLPPEEMGASISAINPNLVIMTAQQLTTASSLLTIAHLLRDLGIPLAYGGQVFNDYPQIRSRFPATFLGEKLEDTVQKVEQLILTPFDQAQFEGNPNPHQALLGMFLKARPSIEQMVADELTVAGIPLAKIEEVNAYTGSRLAAALSLGDVDLMKGEEDWIKGLIKNHNAPEDQLRTYLTAYADAVALHMQEERNPISLWMKEYMARMDR